MSERAKMFMQHKEHEKFDQKTKVCLMCKQLSYLEVAERCLIKPLQLQERSYSIRKEKLKVLDVTEDDFQDASVVILFALEEPRGLILSADEPSQLGKAYAAATRSNRKVMVIMLLAVDEYINKKEVVHPSFVRRISHQPILQDLLRQKRIMSIYFDIYLTEDMGLNQAQKKLLMKWIKGSLTEKFKKCASGIGCGASIAKILLFVFNVGFFLAGAASLGAGIWIRVDPKLAEFARVISPSSGSNDPLLQAASIVLVALGSYILLVGFLGCCGASCENTCMLTTYATTVIYMAIMSIVAGILVAVFSRRVRDTIGAAMDEGIARYNSLGSKALRRAWDSMQVWLECCGRNRPQDWSRPGRSAANDRWSQNYPPSCCQLKDKDPQKIIENNMVNSVACRDGSGGYNTEGCQSKLEDWFRRKSVVIMGVAFGAVAVHFVVAIMACRLISAIKKDKIEHVV